LNTVYEVSKVILRFVNFVGINRIKLQIMVKITIEIYKITLYNTRGNGTRYLLKNFFGGQKS